MVNFPTDNDKRNDFNVAIINFPHFNINISTYVPLEFAVCIHTFYNVTVYLVLNYYVSSYLSK